MFQTSSQNLSRPSDEASVSKLVSEPGAVATGSYNSAKLDDPVATALGSDTDSLLLGQKGLFLNPSPCSGRQKFSKRIFLSANISVARFAGFVLILVYQPSAEALGYSRSSAARTQAKLTDSASSGPA